MLVTLKLLHVFSRVTHYIEGSTSLGLGDPRLNAQALPLPPMRPPLSYEVHGGDPHHGCYINARWTLAFPSRNLRGESPDGHRSVWKCKATLLVPPPGAQASCLGDRNRKDWPTGPPRAEREECFTFFIGSLPQSHQYKQWWSGS